MKFEMKFKMKVLVDRYKLIYGQKYYMKRNHRRCTDIIFYGYMEFDDVIDSDSENDMDNFAWVKVLDSTEMDGDIVSDNIIEIDVEMNEFYRYISKEEYYTKLKEIYDRKVLNFILKRLVDETFQSNCL